MLVFFLLCATADAADLQIVAVPEKPIPPPIVSPSPVMRKIPLLEVDTIQMDGQLTEMQWRQIGMTPWLPLANSSAPPSVSARVLVHPDGYLLGIAGILPNFIATVVLDPTGTRQTWWRLRFESERVQWDRCSLESAAVLSREAWVGLHAASCVPETGPSVRWTQNDGTAEFLLPVDEHYSSATLSFFGSIGSQKGTWAYHGGSGDDPNYGLWLDAPRGRLVVRSLRPKPEISVRILPPPGHIPETWEAELWLRGRQVNHMMLNANERGEAEWVIPDDGLMGAYVLAIALDGAGNPLTTNRMMISSAGVLRVFDWESTLRTPVHRGEAEVWWNLDAPYLHAPILVRDPQGNLLGQGNVDLVQGEGIVRVPMAPSWGPVTIEIPTLLRPSLCVPAEVSR